MGDDGGVNVAQFALPVVQFFQGFVLRVFKHQEFDKDFEPFLPLT